MARSCSLASLITAPSAASPATTCVQRSPPTASDTGYLVVNHPTVRDRSILPSDVPLRAGRSS
ncbi:Uncharacterised protein [Mycobacteroides abscessus subsp. abscessus]|nr:Uncharacterised protein [Mycobacteroides abscessus subsp. abscessus]SKV57464.1 Uncharacterised protein [Mycobacteroides abscessus subsp. abscessus]